MTLNKLFQQQKEVFFKDVNFLFENGVYSPNERPILSSDQKQTEETFGFKWKKEDTFNSEKSLERMRSWLLDRYKEPNRWLQSITSSSPTLLDAGCGAGLSGFEYWKNHSHKINYIGVDVSEAVYVAAKRSIQLTFANKSFVRASIDDLPFEYNSFDIIFSEGVLHHTNSTRTTFEHLNKFLKPQGLFMFYVYRKKGPIREFTDDYIREKLQKLSPEDSWKKLEPLSQLGLELGKLNAEIDIPENIDILGIPAGKINIQRLFYWHVFKAFYDPNLSFNENHHINFDWYAPKNAHRHSINEIEQWCNTNNLTIEHLQAELAGITCVARKN